MAKISRAELKGLIKECLVEVLVEGLSSDNSLSLRESSNKPKARNKLSNSKKSARSPRPALDSVKFNRKIEESVSACTDDPILGNILSDTAKTTLQEQIGNEPGHNQQIMANGDPAAKSASASDPIDMFGEASNNWAALAFNEV